MNDIKEVFEDLKHKKILLVDDDQTIPTAIKLVFKYNNCFIDIAETADNGISLLEKVRYDFILCVYNPPKIKGIEFLKRAKTFQSQCLRILIIGYETEGIKAKALTDGIENVMYKPYTIPSFISNISKFNNTQKINNHIVP